MAKEFIVLAGEKFTVEWYVDARGKSSALTYFEELPFERQKKTLQLMRLLAERGQLFNEQKFRYEGDQLFAIKPSPDRFLCFFFDGAKIIITNAYEKKSDKMPPREKERALKAKADYIKRVKEGNYYD
ncbi:MAG: type II toxin-antitoxin system RelE/ParE family toxin [Candidatus Babeliales bacterium]